MAAALWSEPRKEDLTIVEVLLADGGIDN